MKGKVIKKERTILGNHEYPTLKHWAERLVCQKGRYRITEKMYEYLERSYGYRPSPEVAIQRKIQVKTLWWWTTLSQYKFKVNTNYLINEAFLGYKYDWEKVWERAGFTETMLILLTQKKKR